MLPKAVTKSLQVISRCNLPFTTLQPFILGSSAAISGSLSFLAGMAFSSAPFHYAVEPRRRQRRHGKFVLTDRWRNRSEERRVGKECRSQRRTAHWIKKRRQQYT